MRAQPIPRGALSGGDVGLRHFRRDLDALPQLERSTVLERGDDPTGDLNGGLSGAMNRI